jgi:hypothetical protein
LELEGLLRHLVQSSDRVMSGVPGLFRLSSVQWDLVLFRSDSWTCECQCKVDLCSLITRSGVLGLDSLSARLRWALDPDLFR